jgi:hypothetical protein
MFDIAWFWLFVVVWPTCGEHQRTVTNALLVTVILSRYLHSVKDITIFITSFRMTTEMVFCGIITTLVRTELLFFLPVVVSVFYSLCVIYKCFDMFSLSLSLSLVIGKWIIRLLSFFGLAYNVKRFAPDLFNRGFLQMQQKKLDQLKAKWDWGRPVESLPLMTWQQFKSR